jgi:LemA protein
MYEVLKQLGSTSGGLTSGEAGARLARAGANQLKPRKRTDALARLLAVAENYPQLKANESFNRLMDELAGTENRIAVERMRYNEKVREYNTFRRQFPSNVTAAIFGFKEHPFFEAPAEAKQVPKVNFNR